MIGRLVDEFLDTVHPGYIWGDLLPELCATDLNLINLEAALTSNSKMVPKVFNFKAKPRRVELLNLAQVKVANLANNHSLDYATEGLLETLSVLRKANILPVGGGENIDKARAPVILNVKGIHIGILGFTDNEPSWLASSHTPGVNYIEINDIGLQTLTKELIKLRSQVDLIILTMHWGPNMVERPPVYFQSFARKAVDAGVDIFHGHSAHLFQGVEIYQHKVIFYDCGDFVDDYYVDPMLRNDCSFFFIVEATKKGILSIKLLPTLIERFQVNFAKGKEKELTIQRMQRLSKEFGTQFVETDRGLSIQVD